MEPAGQHANAAIFAADGSARHRIVRAAIAAGVALLAAWVIALALGVLGGFGSLPSLPNLHSQPSDQASSPAPHRRVEPRPVREHEAVVKPASGPSSPSGVGGGSTPP